MAKTIQERIKGISQFFKGMQVENIDGEQIIYVIVQFPEKWIIDETIEEKYNITVKENNNGEWYFIGEMSVGFDAIFDAVEYNIEKMKAAEERASLLRTKIKEMQELFIDENMTLDALRSLEFVWKGKNKNSQTPKKEKMKKEEKQDKDEQ